MELMYLVSYFRHNKTTGGNAYKTELATNDRAEALKKYHALLGEFIANPAYDFVSVSIADSFGNPIQHEFWEEEITE